MSKFLDTALEYAARGWAVFPLRTKGKEPITPRGHLDATTDPELVRAWWTSNPNANIGIAVAPSGLCVLDVDVGPGKNGDVSLKELDAESTLPSTLSARTGGGGLHAVYSLPEGAPARRRIRFRPGLDLLADGYIVAPPSVHPNGSSYAWLGDPSCPVPICPLPASLVPVLGQAHESQSVPYSGGAHATPELLAEAWRALLEHGPAVKGQGGDQHTFEVGALLLNDYDLLWDDAWRLAKGWNDHFPENTWTELRLGEKLRNGCSYASGVRGAARHDFESMRALEVALRPFDSWGAAVEREAGQSVPQSVPPGNLSPELKQSVPPGNLSPELKQSVPSELLVGSELEDQSVPLDFLALVLAAARDLKAYRAGSTSSPDKPVPIFEEARALLGRSFPPTSWLVRGVLTTEAVAVVAGEPKSTKSWAAMEIALAVATNTPAFNEYPTGPEKPVAMFLAEDSARGVRNRLRALAAGRDMAPERVLERVFVSCRQPLDITDDAQLARLIASCRILPEPPALVILDPMRDLHGGDEDSSKEMGDFMARLRALRDIIGASVLFVHHSAKSSQDVSKRRSGQKMRGSGAIHGAVDAGFYIRNVDGDGKCNWSTEIEVELKAAQGAGLFRLDLHVTDDSGGEAVRAEWRVRSIGEGDPDKVAADKDVQAIADFMSEQPDGIATASACAGVIGGRLTRATQALTTLKASGQATEYIRGKKKMGWQLNPAIVLQRKAEVV